MTSVEQLLGLEWTEQRRNSFLGGLTSVSLASSTELYPSKHLWYAESEETAGEWRKYWSQMPLKDPRVKQGQAEKGKRPPIVVLSREKLQQVIVADKNIIIQDAETGEPALIVLRDFMPNLDVLEAMDALCQKTIRERRNDRRDDAGKMAHIGYTAGLAHAKTLQLAHTPVRSKKAGEEEAFNGELQGMCSLIWNMCRSRLPIEIIRDFNDTITDAGLPRMDMGKKLNTTYSITVNKELYSFDKGELAPPSAVAAENYAKHTHNESNGNEWMIALTTGHNVPTADGGNFYSSKYGVLVEAAANTLCVWKVHDHHGTTLWKREERHNCGVSLCVPKSLRAAMKSDNDRARAEAIEGGEVAGPREDGAAGRKRKREEV